MSVNSKMTAIASRVRTLLGLPNKMGLDDMDINLGTAQAEVETQKDLISQISSVLAGKAGNAGGIVPSGSKTITANGTYDVTSYASAEVNVPGIVPSGSKTITTNGTHDVTQYASAEVNVPGIVPSGSKTITTNGTYDVTQYASAVVNVAALPSGVNALASGAFTLSSDYTDYDNPYEISHGLSVTPNFYAIYSETGDIVNGNYSNSLISAHVQAIQNKVTTTTQNVFGVYAYTNNSRVHTEFSDSASAGAYFNGTKIRLWTDSGYRLKGGVTYRWVAGHLNNLG